MEGASSDVSPESDHNLNAGIHAATRSLDPGYRWELRHLVVASQRAHVEALVPSPRRELEYQ